MSENTDAIIDEILDLLGKPQSVAKGDASIAQQQLRGLAEVLKALNEIERNNAAADVAATDRPGFGLRFQKITPYYE